MAANIRANLVASLNKYYDLVEECPTPYYWHMIDIIEMAIAAIDAE